MFRFSKFLKSSNPNELQEAERLDEILQPLHKNLFMKAIHRQ